MEKLWEGYLKPFRGLFKNTPTSTNGSFKNMAGVITY